MNSWFFNFEDNTYINLATINSAIQEKDGSWSLRVGATIYTINRHEAHLIQAYIREHAVGQQEAL